MDPIALPDLAPLGAVLSNPKLRVVLHAGENDLSQLKRRYGLVVASLFDTSLAGRFLGLTALGLDVLLARYLDVALPPSRQKDDWSARPLTPAQERYAVADVEHLIALKDRLREELIKAGRLAWVEEECAALAAEPWPERPSDPNAYVGLKGARALAPRALAILRALYDARDRLARATDRPPFKILSDATLVALAGAPPGDAAALEGVAGCTPRVIARWGDEILGAIARAQALPDVELPQLGQPPRGTATPGAVRRRIEALRRWRAEAAPRFGFDPGVLLPNRLIRAIAEAAPANHAALAAVDGVRRWRVEVLGAELLRAVVG